MHKEVKDYIQKHKKIVTELSKTNPLIMEDSTMNLLRSIFEKNGEDDIHKITYLSIISWFSPSYMDNNKEFKNIRERIYSIDGEILMRLHKENWINETDPSFDTEDTILMITTIIDTLTSNNRYVVNWFSSNISKDCLMQYTIFHQLILKLSTLSLSFKLYDKIFKLISRFPSEHVMAYLIDIMNSNNDELIEFVVDNYNKVPKTCLGVNEKETILGNLNNRDNRKNRILNLLIDTFRSKEAKVIIKRIINDNKNFMSILDETTERNLRAIL